MVKLPPIMEVNEEGHCARRKEAAESFFDMTSEQRMSDHFLVMFVKDP